MAIAILLGALSGAAGFLPLFVALRASRRSQSTLVAAAAGTGLLGVFVSLVILAVALIACAKLAHDVFLPFGVAEIAVFLAATCIYFMWRNRVIGKSA